LKPPCEEDLSLFYCRWLEEVILVETMMYITSSADYNNRENHS
jgi:hypothetical protein